MGSSFIEFRGRGFWAKDTPLQAAMYLLYRGLVGRTDLTTPLTRWRDTLIDWAKCPGSGCINSGLEEYPTDAPAESIADIVGEAQAHQLQWLKASDLARKGIAVGDDPKAAEFWRGVEDDGWTHNAVAMILAAFRELLSGQIDPRYGRLVHAADSEDAQSRTLPYDDVQTRVADNDLSGGPFRSCSFGPDAQVRFVPRDDDVVPSDN
jgi:hypothetical protein